MIIKIQKGDTIDGALNYNWGKEKRDVADILGRNMLLGCDSADDMRRYFASRLRRSMGRMPSKPIFTVSINPAPEDLERLTDDDLREIADFYMQGMGYGDQPYIIFRHRDIEREHLHIVSVTVDREGKRIEAFNERYRSSKLRREIEFKWGLVRAEGRGKNKKKVREELIKQESKSVLSKEQAMTKGAADLRANMRHALRLAERYHYRNLWEYNSVLRRYNIEAEVREIETKDGVRRGMVYYNMDDEGRRMHVGIKGSAISREFSYGKFEERITANDNLDEERKKKRKEAAQRIEKTAQRLLDRGVTEKELEKALDAAGIRLTKAVNAKGVTYGLTFTDTESGEMFKASEVSRDLTVGKIKERLRSVPEGRRLTNDERRSIFREAREAVRRRMEEKGVTEGYAKLDADRLRGEIIERCRGEWPDASLTEIMELTGKAVRKIEEEGMEKSAEERKEFEKAVKRAAFYAESQEQRVRIITYLGGKSDGETVRMRANPTIITDTEGLNIIPSTGKTEALKDEDYAILRDAVMGKLEGREYSGWMPWLKCLSELREEDRRKVYEGMTSAEVKKTINEGMSAKEITEVLLEKGFVIRPQIIEGKVTGYRIQHSAKRTENEGCAAPEWLEMKLRNAQYSSNLWLQVREKVYKDDGGIRWQYRTAVEMTAAFKIKDKAKRDERMEKIADGVSKFKPEVAAEIMRMYREGKDAHKITVRMEEMAREAVTLKAKAEKKDRKWVRGI